MSLSNSTPFNLNIYELNGRKLTYLSPLSEEMDLKKEKNYLFDLSYLNLLSIEGEKARDFLQGQLSCDIKKVTTRQIQQGVLANLQGRVVALLDVIEFNGLQVVLPNDLIEIVKNDIGKAAMFSRVKLTCNQNKYQFFGFYLQNQEDLNNFVFDQKTNDQNSVIFSLLNDAINALYSNLQEDSTQKKHIAFSSTNWFYYNLKDNLFVFIIKIPENCQLESNPNLDSAFVKSKQLHGSLAWHNLKLQHEIIDIYPKTSGLFLPHRIGLHLKGYLDFEKGCYKGQEIIARTHYRAKLKHELQFISYHQSYPLMVGEKKHLDNTISVDKQNNEVEVIDYCPLNDADDYFMAISKRV